MRSLVLCQVFLTTELPSTSWTCEGTVVGVEALEMTVQGVCCHDLAANIALDFGRGRAGTLMRLDRATVSSGFNRHGRHVCSPENRSNKHGRRAPSNHAFIGTWDAGGHYPSVVHHSVACRVRDFVCTAEPPSHLVAADAEAARGTAGAAAADPPPAPPPPRITRSHALPTQRRSWSFTSKFHRV